MKLLNIFRAVFLFLLIFAFTLCIVPSFSIALAQDTDPGTGKAKVIGDPNNDVDDDGDVDDNDINAGQAKGKVQGDPDNDKDGDGDVDEDDIDEEDKPTEITLPPPPSPPCSQWGENGKCTAVKTALGNLNTDPAKFIEKIFSVLLSLGGGIALVLVIKSGYQLMVSRGNPNQIQQAREQLTAAIVGLVFLVFSLVVLQTIGVDILKIPENTSKGKVKQGPVGDKFGADPEDKDKKNKNGDN